MEFHSTYHSIKEHLKLAGAITSISGNSSLFPLLVDFNKCEHKVYKEKILTFLESSTPFHIATAKNLICSFEYYSLLSQCSKRETVDFQLLKVLRY